MVKLFKRRKKDKYLPTEPLEIWLRIISRISLYSLLLFIVVGFGMAILFGLLKLGALPSILIYFLMALFLIFLMTVIPAFLWFWQGREYSKNKLTESIFRNKYN